VHRSHTHTRLSDTTGNATRHHWPGHYCTRQSAVVLPWHALKRTDCVHGSDPTCSIDTTTKCVAKPRQRRHCHLCTAAVNQRRAHSSYTMLSLYQMFKVIVLFINALAILNEPRFLAPRTHPPNFFLILFPLLVHVGDSICFFWWTV
jgi:hypothetical protein